MGSIRGAARRCARTVAALAVLACVAAPAAGAADHEQVKLTASGQAAARVPMLEKADLPKEPGWIGGPTTPDLASTISCGSFSPKQSDLVLNGASKVVYKRSGLQIESKVDVLATPRMVQLDWQRTVTSPRMLACLRTSFAKSGSATTKFVSFKPVAVPRLAVFSSAWRILWDVKGASGVVRVMTDIVLVGRGRTEVTLSTTARLADASLVVPLELRLAATLAARIRA
jgi:hypothetical protein